MVAVLVAAGAAVAAGRTEPAQTQMVLRLHELPPEYSIGPDTGCGVVSAEQEPSLAVRSFALKYKPPFCEYEYERRFLLPGPEPAPPEVISFAIGTQTPEAASAGFQAARDLLASLLGEPHLAEAPTTARIGGPTKLFHTESARLGTGEHEPGTAFFWRSGVTLAAVYLAGMPLATADGVALQLATVQQRHVVAPTPYLESERDDTAVPFEDPRLKLPVYWLGPTFRPGHGRPPAHLEDVFLPAVFGDTSPPGVKELLSYEKGITLYAFTRATWRAHLQRPSAALVRDWRCTRKTTISVAGGRAAIYAGYAKNFADCPRTPPNVFFAEVPAGRMVIGVDLPNCPVCIESGHGPYESVAAMEAIARGLRLRERPGAPAQ